MNAPVLDRRTGGKAAGASSTADVTQPDAGHLSHDHPLIHDFTEIARTAGEIACNYFRPGEKTRAGVHRKQDGSPVTDADLAVNTFLEERLRGLLPDAGWLSEESKDSSARLDEDLVFIVDPIDGTRSFAAGNATWAVSIALVRRQRPIVGIVHAPALGESYVAVAGDGARLNGEPIAVSSRRTLGPDALISGPMGLAQRLRGAGLDFELQPRIPSLAVRIARVAAGTLDAAFVSANAQDWDIAACDLIVAEAGGRLVDFRGRQPLYNRVHTLHGELAAGPAALLRQFTAAAGLPRRLEL